MDTNWSINGKNLYVNECALFDQRIKGKQLYAVVVPEGGAAGAPPPPFRVPEQKNCHISAEICSRTLHLRPQIPPYPSRAYEAGCGVNNFLQKSALPPPPLVCQYLNPPLLCVVIDQ